MCAYICYISHVVCIYVHTSIQLCATGHYKALPRTRRPFSRAVPGSQAWAPIPRCLRRGCEWEPLRFAPSTRSCKHIHVYMYVCMHVCIRICICIFVCVCRCICILYMYVYVYEHICICICMCISILVSTSIYMYVYVYVHRSMHMCKHIYMYLQTITCTMIANIS